jgi:hypothetical protein
MNTDRLSSLRNIVLLLTLIGLLATACASATQPTAKTGFAHQIAQSVKASIQALAERAHEAVQPAGAPSSAPSNFVTRMVKTIQSALQALVERAPLGQQGAPSRP